jgi:shikimate kinase
LAVNSDRVLLVGPRGAGKSTVGPLLAARLGVPFVDTDDLLQPITSVDAPFREREARVLAAVLRGPPAVVAAGGGAVLWDGLEDAARAWTVVWLDATAEVLARRIRESGGRPSLTGRPADEEIGDVLRGRAHLYAAVARSRVETDRLGADAVAAKIAALLDDVRRGKAD